MLLQYMDFNNNTTGSYSWSQIHGLYCTVGIEDHTMTRGLQYTFNNTYADAAMQLGDETAILITTRGSEMRLDYSVIGDSVNLAARLEAQTRNYKDENGKVTPVLYSSYTQEKLENIKSIEVDKIKVKGKEELITIYKPI